MRQHIEIQRLKSQATMLSPNSQPLSKIEAEEVCHYWDAMEHLEEENGKDHGMEEEFKSSYLYLHGLHDI